MKVALIHDCDPGNDDALGILVAAGLPHVELLAVTTGAGHLDAARTARNAAIAMAHAAPVSAPVSAGATLPLVRERMIARFLDLDSALDAERPDLPAVALDRRHSVEVIAAEAAARPGLIIAATGPLTNLALALRLHPDLAGRIGRIVTLGGAWGLGNKTAAAEWNILCDPEAAAIVYGSGVPITMLPVDATAGIVIDSALVAAAERIAGTVGRFAGELLRSLQKTYRPPIFGPPEAPLNDPLALLVAADPSIARSVPARVDIELADGFSYGRTIVDFAGRSERPANCDVVISLDETATRAGFLAALTRLAGLSTEELQQETH